MFARLIVVLFALAGLAGPATAAAIARLPHTTVELLVDAATVGRPATVGVALTPRPGWHTYWMQPGDAGMPTRAQWRLPPGAAAGPLRYPTPEAFLVSGIMNHVYSGRAVLLADIRLPAGTAAPVPLSVRLDWLVCDERLCVPEGADLDAVLPVVAGGSQARPAGPSGAALAAARDALPRPVGGSRFETVGGRIRIAVPYADPASVRSAHFFPLADDEIVFAAPQRVARTADRLIIEAPAVHGAAPQLVRGVLRIERADGGPLGLELAAAPGAVPQGRPLGTEPALGFAPAFGWALLGGLLLNLMPCVFPILSLKALSLARAGESAAGARAEGLAYAAGVILVCVGLGAMVIAAARAGHGAGWAFQLQDPRVILLILLLTLAIGLNFLGLFLVGGRSPRGAAALIARPGVAGAFWSGALAAVIATPCTGPFMAAALGSALLLPPAAGLAVFAGLGAGIALPFVAIGFVPALRRRLPRPGPWMERLRRVLAVPMLLTTAALLWVLGRQVGTAGLLIGLGLAALLAAGLWWIGLTQARRRPALLPALVVLGGALAAPALLAAVPEADRHQSGLPEGAIAFSPQVLDELRAARVPVFLYFTADWCLTCKVNEQGALGAAGSRRRVPRGRHPHHGRRLDATRSRHRPLPRRSSARRHSLLSIL